MRAILLCVAILATGIVLTPPATACGPTDIDGCAERANEIVDFVLGGPGDCYDLPDGRRLCWGP